VVWKGGRILNWDINSAYGHAEANVIHGSSAVMEINEAIAAAKGER